MTPNFRLALVALAVLAGCLLAPLDLGIATVLIPAGVFICGYLLLDHYFGDPEPKREPGSTYNPPTRIRLS